MKFTKGEAVIITGGAHKGRTGIFKKVCSTVFPDHSRIDLDLKPRQRTQEVNKMIENIYIEKKPSL